MPVWVYKLLSNVSWWWAKLNTWQATSVTSSLRLDLNPGSHENENVSPYVKSLDFGWTIPAH